MVEEPLGEAASVAMGAELHIAVGIPGCGKSTWVNGSFDRVVSSDQIRDSLRDPRELWRPDASLGKVLRSRVRAALRIDDCRLCVDATNLQPAYRVPLLQIASEYEVPGYAHRFKISTNFGECQRRNLGRDSVVPEETMRLFHSAFLRHCSFSQLSAEGWIVYEV